MSARLAHAVTALSLLLGAQVAVVHAEEKAKPEPALGSYLSALREKRLVQTETAKVDELRGMLSKAEALALAGRNEDAVVLLYELVESPRFSDYAELEEMSAARFSLGASLHALGAEESARSYLRRVIDQGPENPYFAPAFRSYTDVALSQGDLTKTVADLDRLAFTMPEDAQNELHYLHGRERYDARDDAAATDRLSRISKHSRFYANAQYLLGAIAARGKRYRSAESHFCKIASAGDDNRYSFFVDSRYFAVKDLARLGLGRVADEERRSDDAFYYYFQVPQDSPHLPEAMFEAAYATYEGGDHETSLDLLDQLEARFPHSAFADEASILRGYAALSGCEFEQARKQFSRFITHFGPVSEEIDRVLDNPARRAALYDDLAHAAAAPKSATPERKELLALLQVDPVFSELHARVTQLDAEAARAGRVPDVMDAIAARMAGSDAPRAPSATPADTDADADADSLERIETELAELREALPVLGAQLDTMRKLGAKKAELAPIEKDVSLLARRANQLKERVKDARFASLAAAPAEPAAAAAGPAGSAPGATGPAGSGPGSVEPSLDQLFAADVARARGFERRVLTLRPKLLAAANERALIQLTALRDRLHGFLRRARIGRIDAIMGSKRRIEMQIESLSAGRVPSELSNPLRVQGFLAGDEEYWPFEGEDWPDEYIENYGPGKTKAKPQPASGRGSAGHK